MVTTSKSFHLLPISFCIRLITCALLSFTLGCAGFTPIEKAHSSSQANRKAPSKITLTEKKEPFIWPLKEARFSRGFKAGRRPHLGLDLMANKGTPIYAAHEGRVLYSGNEFSGFGKLVIIETDDHWATFYSHCNSILVKAGKYIKQGEQIATVGNTGKAKGYHLHFEMRHNRVPINPLANLPRPARGIANVK